MHPLNGSYSHWIDDKLTLKYLCAGTDLDKYMPKYYYQINEKGNVFALTDSSQSDGRADIDNVLDLLEELGELAIKRVAGSLGEGFYKISYKAGMYMWNDEAISKIEISKRLSKLREYLITEYLHPHQDMIPFGADTVNTLRYLIGRDSESGKMNLIKSYIRFGTEKSGFVENYGAGGVLCFLSNDGKFNSGNMLDMDTMKNIILNKHPDTGVLLNGKIPLWDEIKKAAWLFGRYFPQMDYLGIDFVVTNKNEVKILEINSLTSLDALQLEGSVLESPAANFFKERIK